MTDARQQQRVERIHLGGRRYGVGLALALVTAAETARERGAQVESVVEPLRISTDQLRAPTIVANEPGPNRHERRKAAARRCGR